MENQSGTVKPILLLNLMRLENQIARPMDLILQPRQSLQLENQFCRAMMIIWHLMQSRLIGRVVRLAAANISDSPTRMVAKFGRYTFAAVTQIRRSHRQKCRKCDRSWQRENRQQRSRNFCEAPLNF